MPELVLTRDSFRPLESDMTDDEIMAQIPPEFFKHDFDATRYVLEVRRMRPSAPLADPNALPTVQNLPDMINDQALEREIASKERAMEVVDSKLSTVIMDNYKSFGAHHFLPFNDCLVACRSSHTP